MTGSIDVTADDGVVVVTITNPPLNLLTMNLRADLRAIAEGLSGDSSIRAVVITGSGTRSFSAGSDIREFPTTAAAGRARGAAEHACYDAISNLPQPVVAALFGHVLGGGLELALACDLRVADEHTRLGLPEVKLGVFPSGGGTQRLPRVIPVPQAKRLMFLGDVLDADRAYEIGLVDDVVPAGQTQEAALGLARRIAGQPARAVQAIKRAVDHGLTFGSRAGQVMEDELAAELFTSADAREGVQAFLENRPARFTHE